MVNGVTGDPVQGLVLLEIKLQPKLVNVLAKVANVQEHAIMEEQVPIPIYLFVIHSLCFIRDSL